MCDVYVKSTALVIPFMASELCYHTEKGATFEKVGGGGSILSAKALR